MVTCFAVFGLCSILVPCLLVQILCRELPGDGEDLAGGSGRGGGEGASRGVSEGGRSERGRAEERGERKREYSETSV